MKVLTVIKGFAFFAFALVAALHFVPAVFADGYDYADPVQIEMSGISKDPTSINALIAKVRRGVVAISPHSGTDPMSVETGGSIGSGFIVDKDGWFLTNVHVLGGSSWSEVTLWNDKTYRGELVAVDPGIDTAIGRLIGCPADEIHPVAFGDSDTIVSGELALAMGQPGDQTQMNVDPSNPLGYFGLKQTATVAVIAGKVFSLEFPLELNSRYKTSPFGTQYGSNFPYVIRMQTPIAGGNSGGPLFNEKGEVIGINFFGGTWMFGQGHNYAVPITLAKEFYYSVKKQTQDGVPIIHNMGRPWLGLDICMPRNVDNSAKYIEFLERYRPEDKILIYGVRKNSPAWNAGFMGGDEILQVDNQTFESPEMLRYYILSQTIDAELVFTIKRGEVVSLIRVMTDVKRNYDSDFSV